MIGVDSKKENFADDSRSSFNPKPQAIIMPDRDIPGTMANACSSCLHLRHPVIF